MYLTSSGSCSAAITLEGDDDISSVEMERFSNNLLLKYTALTFFSTGLLVLVVLVVL